MKNARVEKALQQVRTFFDERSERERTWIQLSALVLICLIAFMIVRSVVDTFESQSLAMSQLETDVDSVVSDLKRYAKLRAQRESIENQFKEVDLSEGALSYLESLIKDKAGFPSTSFEIQPQLPPKPFGTNFEQTGFRITLKQVNDFPKLITLAKEIVSGSKPLLLTQMRMDKSSSGVLQVTLEISSIKRIRNR